MNKFSFTVTIQVTRCCDCPDFGRSTKTCNYILFGSIALSEYSMYESIPNSCPRRRV